MWRWMIACLIGFAGCGSLQPLPAQDITVPASVNVKPGRLVKIQAQASFGLKWLNVNAAVDCIPSDDGKWAIVSVDPAIAGPATFTVAVYGAKLAGGQAVATDPVFVQLVVSAQPVPPSPPPTPQPTAKSVWAVVVVDNNKRTPEIARIVLDESLWKSVEAGGHRWRVIGTDESAIAKLNLAPFVQQAGGAPALILLTRGGPDDGKVLRAMPLPADSQGVLAAIKGVSQ